MTDLFFALDNHSGIQSKKGELCRYQIHANYTVKVSRESSHALALLTGKEIRVLGIQMYSLCIVVNGFHMLQ